jgi:hypothetical protein
MLANFTSAAQQQTVFKAEKIKSDQLPPEVLDAYKKKFPQANLKDILKLPESTYKSDWQIDENDYPGHNEQYYTLYLTGDNVKLEALYDSKGNLIRATENAKNIRLPQSISTYIVKNYKGYAITSDKVKRFIEPNSVNADWEVGVTKGSAKKRLLFDKSGNFIKEK